MKITGEMAAYNRKHSVGLAYAHKYEGGPGRLDGAYSTVRGDARHVFRDTSMSQISETVLQTLEPSAVKRLDRLEKNR